MKETKKRIIELKKDMLYEKTLNEKLNDIETLNSARTSHFTGFNTFRSDYTNENNTYRSENLSTFKTIKSVRFDQENEKKDSEKNDYLTDQATAQRYKKLTDFVNRTSAKKENEALNLSLPLAPTPRSMDTLSMNSLSDVHKQFKSVESLNSEFIKEYTFRKSYLNEKIFF